MQAETEQEPAPVAEEEAHIADEAPAEPEAEPVHEAIVEPEPESETASEPEAKASSEPEPVVEPEPEPEATETAAEAEPIVEPEPEPEATEEPAVEPEAVAEEAAPPAPERVSPVIEVQLRMPLAHGSGWASATLHSSEITHTLLHTVMLALFSSLVKFFSLQSFSSCGDSGSSDQGPLLTPLREPG